MKVKLRLLLAVLCLFFSTVAPVCTSWSAAALAQGSGSAEQHVQVSLLADSLAIMPGRPFEVGIKLKMEDGWHTYYKECGDAGMPTSVVWQLPRGFSASEIIWPKPDKFSDAGIVTYGYKDSVMLAVRITPPKDIKSGEIVSIKGLVKYLTCKDVCLPGKQAVAIDLPVSTIDPPQAPDADAFKQLGEGFKGSVNDLSMTPEGHGAKASSATVSVLEQNFQSAAPKEGLFYYLGFALLGGFILNFMPCVLPVIAIKVMSFLEQAQEAPGRVRLLGLTFSAGIISSFMVLAGLVASIKAAGQSIGWGFQFQYPGFLIVMCAVVLLMALSFFGLFYVNVGVGGELDKLSAREGFVGTFFKGVLATVLSTPCTAPFLGTALGFAFAEPASVIVGIFLASGLGMALPYLLLTLNPDWLKFLPKPGAWMEKFKQSMGFVLMATVIWLDSVLANQIGPSLTAYINYWLVGLALCAWIIASYTDLTSETGRKVKVWSVAAAIMGLLSWFCILGQPAVMAAIELKGESTAVAAVQSGSAGAGESVTENGITWEGFTVDKLNQHLTEGKTVLLDFTADWCQTCQVNEKTVLNNNAVRDKLQALKVVTMRADWTRQDPEITKLLSKFGRAGVPLYVIFPAGKPSAPLVLPEVITVDLVLSNLDQAGASH